MRGIQRPKSLKYFIFSRCDRAGLTPLSLRKPRRLSGFSDVLRCPRAFGKHAHRLAGFLHKIWLNDLYIFNKRAPIRPNPNIARGTQYRTVRSASLWRCRTSQRNAPSGRAGQRLGDSDDHWGFNLLVWANLFFIQILKFIKFSFHLRFRERATFGQTTLWNLSNGQNPSDWVVPNIPRGREGSRGAQRQVARHRYHWTHRTGPGLFYCLGKQNLLFFLKAALYRLGSGDLNPLHVDSGFILRFYQHFSSKILDFAKISGFPQVFIEQFPIWNFEI